MDGMHDLGGLSSEFFERSVTVSSHPKIHFTNGGGSEEGGHINQQARFHPVPLSKIDSQFA